MLGHYLFSIYHLTLAQFLNGPSLSTIYPLLTLSRCWKTDTYRCIQFPIQPLFFLSMYFGGMDYNMCCLSSRCWLDNPCMVPCHLCCIDTYHSHLKNMSLSMKTNNDITCVIETLIHSHTKANMFCCALQDLGVILTLTVVHSVA